MLKEYWKFTCSIPSCFKFIRCQFDP